MKQKLRNLKEWVTTYELFIAVGLLMIIAASTKLLGWLDYSSDVFWLIAGLALTVEGAILLKKQRMFNRKYKIVLRKEKQE